MRNFGFNWVSFSWINKLVISFFIKLFLIQSSTEQKIIHKISIKIYLEWTNNFPIFWYCWKYENFLKHSRKIELVKSFFHPHVIHTFKLMKSFLITLNSFVRAIQSDLPTFSILFFSNNFHLKFLWFVFFPSDIVAKSTANTKNADFIKFKSQKNQIDWNKPTFCWFFEYDLLAACGYKWRFKVFISALVFWVLARNC
jgi:hypothetical protein